MRERLIQLIQAARRSLGVVDAPEVRPATKPAPPPSKKFPSTKTLKDELEETAHSLEFLEQEHALLLEVEKWARLSLLNNCLFQGLDDAMKALEQRRKTTGRAGRPDAVTAQRARHAGDR